MKKEITLGDSKYMVPRLNIGQLERVTELFSAGGSKVAFAILRIALERAEPAVPDVGVIEATTEEVRLGMRAILVMSGLSDENKEPPGGAPAGETAPAGAS